LNARQLQPLVQNAGDADALAALFEEDTVMVLPLRKGLS
jgi:hypothetical protein